METEPDKTYRVPRVDVDDALSLSYQTDLAGGELCPPTAGRRGKIAEWR